MTRQLSILRGLYEQSETHRRVLFLEAVADAIVRLESAPDLEEPCAQLRATRERDWGRNPWPRATEEQTFHGYVTALARGFTGASTGNRYPGRKLSDSHPSEVASNGKPDPIPAHIRAALDADYE